MTGKGLVILAGILFTVMSLTGCGSAQAETASAAEETTTAGEETTAAGAESASAETPAEIRTITAATKAFISPHNGSYFLLARDEKGAALREDVNAVLKELKEDGIDRVINARGQYAIPGLADGRIYKNRLEKEGNADGKTI